MNSNWTLVAMGVIAVLWLVVRIMAGRMQQQRRGFKDEGPFRQAMRQVKERKSDDTDKPK